MARTKSTCRKANLSREVREEIEAREAAARKRVQESKKRKKVAIFDVPYENMQFMLKYMDLVKKVRKIRQKT